MGVNNRARRAAKKRKRVGGRPGGGGPGGQGATGGSFADQFADQFAGQLGDAADDRVGFDEREVANVLLGQALAECSTDPTAAGRHARLLTRSGGQVPLGVIVDVVDGVLVTTLLAVLRGGWGPVDLGEVARRRLSSEHLPLLTARLAAEAARHPDHLVAAEWRVELASLGPAGAADLRSAAVMERALGLMAMLRTLPALQQLIPPPGLAGEAPRASAGTDTKQLARVRALLAKAESTQFPDEAEALSAKAQELISQYALDRLVAAADDATGPAQHSVPVIARRLWVDAPYVLPKAMLIQAVAGANRCSSVVSEQLGFSTVVGAPTDLDALELLTTSLLVQANTALLRAGRHTTRDGTSRTTSFRRSFLVSYATRIGERLRLADHDVTEGSDRAGELVPLLRAREEQVAAAISEMFPAVVHRETTVSNMSGWAEGRAAADLAHLDSNLQVRSRAG